MEEIDFKKEYELVWKDIVENKNGELNKDAVMRELYDYSRVMDNCTKAYDLLTNGTISKPNTMFHVVENMFFENNPCMNWDKEDIKNIIEDNKNDYENLKKELFEYFEID